MLNVRSELGGEIDAKKEKLIPAKDGNLEYIYYDASKRSQITWDFGDYKNAAQQLVEKTEWNNPEYMILDLPPGLDEITREILPTVDSTILVMQPHKYSISNTNRVIEFCRDESVPVAGIIINFAYVSCPHCNQIFKIFDDLPEDIEAPILAEVPVCNSPRVRDFLPLDRIIEAINDPVELRKKSSMMSQLVKLAVEGGMLDEL